MCGTSQPSLPSPAQSRAGLASAHQRPATSATASAPQGPTARARTASEGASTAG